MPKLFRPLELHILSIIVFFVLPIKLIISLRWRLNFVLVQRQLLFYRYAVISLIVYSTPKSVQ